MISLILDTPAKATGWQCVHTVSFLPDKSHVNDTMTTSDPVSQDQTPALASIWKQSTTAAVALTLLASCVMAINVHNPIEALGHLLFTVPVTFLIWWAICAFLVWVWRKTVDLFAAWLK